MKDKKDFIIKMDLEVEKEIRKLLQKLLYRGDKDKKIYITNIMLQGWERLKDIIDTNYVSSLTKFIFYGIERVHHW